MKTKKEFKYFTIWEYEKEQLYLQDMHKQGWKLIKITGIGTYHFEKSKPEDVIYQLDYNKEGLTHKEEYVQLFKDCGWEYMMDFVGYSYFRKPTSEMDGDEKIFCDEESRLAMMERVYRGRLRVCLILICTLLLPLAILNFVTHKNFMLGIFFATTIILYTIIIIQHTAKFNQYKHNIKK